MRALVVVVLASLSGLPPSLTAQTNDSTESGARDDNRVSAFGAPTSSVPVWTPDMLGTSSSGALAMFVPGATGRTPGAFSLSMSGAAIYSIPLWSPPGVNGLQPAISLEYSNQRGAGFVGMGWAVGGLSAITRCTRTIAQDGTAGYVDLTVNDRYCLNGNRLRLVSGTYGAAGSTYATEIETFSRITAGGTAGTGPESFVVERADGLIYEYGTTVDSRVEPATGVASARFWAISKIRDRSGNEIRFTYTEDTATGQHRIAKIEYPFTSAGGPYYKIEFVAETRPTNDFVAGYSAGYRYQETQRLDQVRVSWDNSGWQVVRKYDLTYDQDALTGRSRATQLVECDGGTNCLLPTTMAYYTNSSNGWSGTDLLDNLSASPSDVNYVHWIDVNGDGRDDLVFQASAVDRFWYHWMAPIGNLQPGTSWGPGTTSVVPSAVQTLDFNGDGKQDLAYPVVQAGSTLVKVMLSTGTGFGAVTTAATLSGTRSILFADINGDGRTDLLSTLACDTSVKLRLNQGGSLPTSDTVAYTLPSAAYACGNPFGMQTVNTRYLSSTRSADLTGDSQEDVFIYTCPTAAACSGTTGFWRVLAMSGGTVTEIAQFQSYGTPRQADFNGDGLTDVVYNLSAGELRIRLSTGTGLTGAITTNASVSSTLFADALVADWNADGLSDFLYPSGTTWMVAPSTGEAFGTHQATGVAYATSHKRRPFARNIGNYDLGYISSGKLRKRSVIAYSGVDVLGSAIDGFGVTTYVSYCLFQYDLVAGPPAAVYPLKPMLGKKGLACWLTKTDASGNGTGDQTAIVYEGGLVDQSGRGFVGFAKRSAVFYDPLDNPILSADIEYEQAFPKIGLIKTSHRLQPSGTPIEQTNTSYSVLSYGSGAGMRQFPYPASSTTKYYEVGGPQNGTWVSTVATTVATVDLTSGLMTDRTTTITEQNTGINPASTRTQRVYHSAVFNDTANWCLGRPSATQVTASHTLADGAAVVRLSSQAWNGAKCRPTQTQIEPGDTQWQVTTVLSYDDDAGNPAADFGNVTSVAVTGTNMAARTTTLGWGSRGQFPVSVTNPLGQVTSQGWDFSLGVPTTATDPNTLPTTWNYDPFGRRVEEIRPDQTRTTWDRIACSGSCDPRTRYQIVQHEKDTTGADIRTATSDVDQYDRAYKVAQQMASGANAVRVTDFDFLGRPQKQYRPYWAGGAASGYTQYSFDTLGRVTAVGLYTAAGVLDRSTSTSYRGLAVVTTDAKGNSTTQTRNAWGNVVRVTDAATQNTQYQYNAFGSLTRVTDALGNVTSSVTYNQRGAKLTQSDVDMGLWTFLPNALGEVEKVRDAKTAAPNWTSQVTYDLLGRVTQRMEAEGTSSWTWGTSSTARNIGKLESLSGPDGYAESYTYDAYSRPATRAVTADQPTQYQYAYTYNNLGRLDNVTYPASTGQALRLAYEYTFGYVSKVKDFNAPTTVPWQLNASDESGAVIDEQLGNNVQVVTGFDPLTGLMETRQAGVGGGTVIQNLAYGWDLNGNLSQRQDLNQSLIESFFYDALNRLDYSQLNGAQNLDLTYDVIGNITAKSGVGSYTYDATRKHAVATAGGATHLYDANGNLQSRTYAYPLNNWNMSLSWFGYNLPRRIERKALSQSSEFSYGPERNRWKQVAVEAGVTETTIYVGDLMEKVTRNGVTTWKHYVQAPTGTAAVFLRYSDATPAKTYYLTHDHLGSTDKVLDSSGAVVAVAESFDAFGNRRGSNWAGSPTSGDMTAIAGSTRDGFTGHEHLDNLALIHMNGRVYDPVIGRFLSPDPFVQAPLNGQSLNRYSYVWNNPLSMSDPSGFWVGTGEPVCWDCTPHPPPRLDSASLMSIARGLSCNGSCIAYDVYWEAHYLQQARGEIQTQIDSGAFNDQLSRAANASSTAVATGLYRYLRSPDGKIIDQSSLSPGEAIVAIAAETSIQEYVHLLNQALEYFPDDAELRTAVADFDRVRWVLNPASLGAGAGDPGNVAYYWDGSIVFRSDKVGQKQLDMSLERRLKIYGIEMLYSEVVWHEGRHAAKVNFELEPSYAWRGVVDGDREHDANEWVRRVRLLRDLFGTEGP